MLLIIYVLKKIVSFIAQNYYWSGLKKIVKHYIKNCHICRYAKTPKDQYNSLLKLLPIFSNFWTDNTLDFITGLSINNSYNIILMIIDCLMRKKHYNHLS